MAAHPQPLWFTFIGQVIMRIVTHLLDKLNGVYSPKVVVFAQLASIEACITSTPDYLDLRKFLHANLQKSRLINQELKIGDNAMPCNIDGVPVKGQDMIETIIKSYVSSKYLSVYD